MGKTFTRVVRTPGADYGLGKIADDFSVRSDWGSAKAKRAGLDALERLHRQYRAFELKCGGPERDFGRLWNALVPSLFSFCPHPEVEAGELGKIPDERLPDSFRILKRTDSALFANLPRIIREMRNGPRVGPLARSERSGGPCELHDSLITLLWFTKLLPTKETPAGSAAAFKRYVSKSIPAVHSAPPRGGYSSLYRLGDLLDAWHARFPKFPPLHPERFKKKLHDPASLPPWTDTPTSRPKKKLRS